MNENDVLVGSKLRFLLLDASLVAWRIRVRMRDRVALRSNLTGRGCGCVFLNNITLGRNGPLMYRGIPYWSGFN